MSAAIVAADARRARVWRAGERGSIAPLVVMSALLLFAVLAFSIDQGIACAVKVRQENALDAARTACLDASFALAAKNDDDPGLAVARRVADALRAEGCAGTAAVWFYEAPEGELPASRRVWGIAVQVREDAPTVFARGYGVDALPVASKRVIVAEPFSGTEVWRPVGSGGELFDVEVGDGDPVLTRVRFAHLDEGPEELARAVRGAVAAANSQADKEELT